MSPWTKLSGIVVAFGMLALIALAPSAANAHAGHSHAATTETRAATGADVAKSASAERAQELRSAGIAVRHAQHEGDCGDRGCCGNGHCAGCCTALAPSALAVLGSPAKWLRVAHNADLPPGLGTSGPPRPPRSFV
jgi:hypothetical protein